MGSSEIMRGVVMWFAILVGLLPPAVADAEVQELYQLESRLELMAASKDSLLLQRAQVVEAADSLALRIDSLKGAGEPAPALEEALRYSLVLEQRLVTIDRLFEALMVEEEEHRNRLRLVYDWEIGNLIQRLAKSPDRGLLQQLVIYQEARESLGDGLERGRLGFGEGMTISADDSPEEIGQKVDLMDDIATRLERERGQNAERLTRLEEEHRLRSQVSVFATEIRLFDEHLPEARVIVRVERTTKVMGGNRSRTEGLESDGDFAADMASPSFAPAEDIGNADSGPADEGLFDLEQVLVAQTELSRQPVTLGEIAADDLALEIRKLKARQTEIRQLESVARKRAEAFRARLLELLQGNP